MYIRVVLLLIVSFLTFPQIFAANHGDKARTDSLMNVAKEHIEHGRFDKCSEILEGMLVNLSKRDQNKAYGLLAANAELAGDYVAEYKYLQLCGVKKGLKKGLKKEGLEFTRILSLQPIQSVSRPSEDVKIDFFVDSLFLNKEFRGCSIRVPAEIDGKKEMMIFDNGCEKFSLASESFARSHGITPIGVNGVANGVVDTSSMWIGVCKSVRIDSILFENILFMVIPDKKLENPITKIDAIIGCNMLKLMGEVVFNNLENTITFPAKQEQRESNMSFMNGGLQYVDVELGNDTLRFQLDIGSTFIGLNAKYFNRCKNYIESEGVFTSKSKGGVGGMTMIEGYVMKNLSFNACGGIQCQEETFVSIEEDYFSENNYGNIGANFLLSFDNAVFNLDKMYFYVF